MLNTVIYSLNRPCQLHALLESWERFVAADPADVPQVLYCYTADAYARGYARTRECFPKVKWIPQVHFRVDALAAVASEASPQPFTMFLVDDQIIRRSLRIGSAPKLGGDMFAVLDERPDIACISLRLSPKITRCYTLNTGTPPPMFNRHRDLLTFTWRGQRGDWGYPMSLDGHIFRTKDVLPLLQSTQSSWSNPNTQESAMASRPPDASLMACFEDHKAVNIPANAVQTTFSNRHMESGLSPKELNARYLAGETIDIEPLIATENVACHVEAVYALK